MVHSSCIRCQLILAFLAVTLGSLAAQDLHVYFDALTDSTHYVQNGRPTSRPIVRKGEQVVLHVRNYNNYLYNVQLTCEDATTTQQGDPLAMLNMGGMEGSPFSWLMGSGSPLDAFGGMMPPSVGSSGTISGWGGTEQEKNLNQEVMAKQLAAFQSAVMRAEARAEELTLLEEKAQAILEAQQIQRFAAVELKNLCLNPHLSPTQLRSLTQEYMSRIFGEENASAIDLSTVIRSAESQKQFATINADYHRQVVGYAADVNLLEALAATLQTMEQETPNPTTSRVAIQAAGVVSTAKENLATFQANEQQLATHTDQIQSMDVQELSDLRIHYLSIMENDFQKTFRQTATSDVMNFQLTFTPIDSVAHTGLSTRTVQPAAVKVYGGMQVQASVGVGFGQFFERPQTYFVRDSVIRQSEKDAFTPYLSSYVHFYPQGRREVSLGGSFGIGLPIGSGSSLDAMTFFLGPSLVVGREQRIILSGGLMGGRVEQLSNGYVAGDRFDLSSDLLQTEAVYKLGYSVGLSFKFTGR